MALGVQQLYPKEDKGHNSNNNNAVCHAGLILIHSFPLSLLFHNHRSLPVSIRGYHVQTFLTLLWLPYTSSNTLCRVCVFLPSLPSLLSIPPSLFPFGSPPFPFLPFSSLVPRPHPPYPHIPTLPIYTYIPTQLLYIAWAKERDCPNSWP